MLHMEFCNHTDKALQIKYFMCCLVSSVIILQKNLRPSAVSGSASFSVQPYGQESPFCFSYDDQAIIQ